MYYYVLKCNQLRGMLIVSPDSCQYTFLCDDQIWLRLNPWITFSKWKAANLSTSSPGSHRGKSFQQEVESLLWNFLRWTDAQLHLAPDIILAYLFQLCARLCKTDVGSRGPQRAASHTGVQRHCGTTADGGNLLLLHFFVHFLCHLFALG